MKACEHSIRLGELLVQWRWRHVKNPRRNAAISGRTTQQELADVSGLSRGYISDLERGTKQASLETLATLCRVTGIDARKVLGLQ